MHAREIIFVDIGRDPDIVERAERIENVARRDCCAARGLVVDHRAADRRAHPDRRIGGADRADVCRFHAEQFQLALGRVLHRSRQPRGSGNSGRAAQMRGLFRLQVLGLGGHEVGAVERDDRLTAPHVVPLRNAHLFDSSGDARDDARDAAVVERHLAVGLEHRGQFDLAHFAERRARYARGIQLKQTPRRWFGGRFAEPARAASRPRRCRAMSLRIHLGLRGPRAPRTHTVISRPS